MSERLVQKDRSRVSKAVIEETVEMSVRRGESLSFSLRRLHRLETGARLVSSVRRTNPCTCRDRRLGKHVGILGMTSCTFFVRC